MTPLFYDRTGSLEKEMNGFPRVLTNFTPTHFPIYESAIQMYGDPNLYITILPEDSVPWACYSLMVKGPRSDLGGFWLLFERLRNFSGIR